MSPAFVNRFDVIVLEEQLSRLSDEDLKQLINILFQNSVEKITENKEEYNDIIRDYEDDFAQYFQNNIAEKNTNEDEFDNSINNKP